jgi:hypothetical protein
MKRLRLATTVVLIVSAPLAATALAKQPKRAFVRLGDDQASDQGTYVSAGIGERLTIVDKELRAEIEVTVRKLPTDKQAVIHVQLRSKQEDLPRSLPMSLPLNRWLRLLNANSGHGLAVKERSMQGGAKLVQEKVGAEERGLLWRFVPVAEGWYAIQNRVSEQVAALPDARKDAGANLVQVPLDKSSTDQQWRPLWIVGNRFVIVNRRSGQTLAVAYGATHSGATICQWPLHLDWRQHQWRLEPVQAE